MEDKPYGIKFYIDKDGDVAWFYEEGAPDLTVEEAKVISHMRGLHKIGKALENLAMAVESLAEKLPSQD